MAAGSSRPTTDHKILWQNAKIFMYGNMGRFDTDTVYKFAHSERIRSAKRIWQIAPTYTSRIIASFYSNMGIPKL